MASPLTVLACGATLAPEPAPEPDIGAGDQTLVDCAEAPDDTPPASIASGSIVSVQQALRRATFTGIGDLPGGEFVSEAHDVDAAGERVVGVATSASGRRAVVWTRAGGLVTLADSTSAAYAISDSGCVIVGGARTFRAPREGERTIAARWVGSEPVEFAPQPLGMFRSTEGIAVSGDGGTIVGRAYQDVLPFGFVWRASDFSIRSPDNDQNLATNEDGSVLVGRTTPSRSGGPSFALLNGEPLPYPFEPECDSGACTQPCITPGQCIASAQGVSADGSIIVGFAVNEAENGPGLAVQWMLDAGEVSITILSARSASARAVSASGRVVVGSEAPDGASVATRWVDGRAESIPAALEDEGIVLDGWQLTSATNVSRDGEFIVGTGVNPDGNTEGWLARLPLR